MAQRSAEEVAARVAESRAVHAAVRSLIDEEGESRRLWFVALPERYRDKAHPVLGPVNVDEVIGLRAHYQRAAVDWAKYWLGLRGFLEVMDYHGLTRQQDQGKWPGGCPSATNVPDARHYQHPQGGQIIVWASRDVDAYTDPTHTKRKQIAVTPEKLEEGYGAWREIFYDHAGTKLTPQQVTAICRDAGISREYR